jgi:hypothetical protein
MEDKAVTVGRKGLTPDEEAIVLQDDFEDSSGKGHAIIGPMQSMPRQRPLDKHMNRVIGAVLLILIVYDSALSQIDSGTIAVMYYTPEKIIIAADSREKVVGNDGRTTHRDDECKLSSLGNKIAFVASGFSGYDKKGPGDKLSTWRASAEAHQAYSDVLAQLKNTTSRRVVWLVPGDRDHRLVEVPSARARLVGEPMRWPLSTLRSCGRSDDPYKRRRRISIRERHRPAHR